MGIVGVDEIRREVADHPGEAEGGGEVDLVGGGEAHQVVALARAPGQLTLRVGDERGAVPARAQAEDGQEDLVLSPAPRAGRVDVEGEHSSQSFTNFTAT